MIPEWKTQQSDSVKAWLSLNKKNAIRNNLTRPLDLFIANILILILFNPKHIFAIKAFTFFSFLDSP